MEASDKDFGVKQADGSWSGIIGMVAAKARPEKTTLQINLDIPHICLSAP